MEENNLAQCLNSSLKEISVGKKAIHNFCRSASLPLTTNALIALGASAINVVDVGEFLAIRETLSSTVISLASLNELEAKNAQEIIRISYDSGIPIILDISGAAVLENRRQFAINNLDMISVLRANHAEAMAVSGSKPKAIGPDSWNTYEEALEPIKNISQLYNCTVLATGELDVIATKDKPLALVNHGHPMMSKVTGTGCALSAITGAFIDPDDLYISCLMASVAMGIAGEVAASSSLGPGSWAVNFLDALYSLQSHTDKCSLRVSFR